MSYNKTVLVLMFLAGMNLNLNADVTMQHSDVIPDIDHERPTRPKPIIRPALMYGVHYHTYVNQTASNCDDYIEMLKEKDEKITALLEENARLKEEAQTGLQKHLKEEYEKELKKFEERRK